MKRSTRLQTLILAGGLSVGAIVNEAPAQAALAQHGEPPSAAKLASRLEKIHVDIVDLEQRLIDGARDQKKAQAKLKVLRVLIKLRREERSLGAKRVAELEKTLKVLEERRASLREKINERRRYIHHFLTALEKQALQGLTEEGTVGKTGGVRELFPAQEREKTAAPRRKILANLAGRGLKELEMLKIDLSDAGQIESKIQEERQQLNNLFQDLDEQEGVLKLNQQIQAEAFRHSQEERLAQLENYRKLKSAETRVQELINHFNSRQELERAVEDERGYSRAMTQSVFANLKGKLGLPVPGGKILSNFGRAFDAKSQLFVFKKGIEILSPGGKNQPVRAVSGGKIAFSGELPSYGRVAIVDHGDHFYSLCAHLGSLNKKAGEVVAAGESLGLTDDLGTPVYFEIRARNVAVNPLQWISN